MRKPTFAALALLLCGNVNAEMVNQWTFEDGTANDYVGGLSAITDGDLRIDNGVAYFDGIDDYIQTDYMTGDITERTIVTWLSMTDFSQRKGGVFVLDEMPSVYTSINNFDGLVYAEARDSIWHAGSAHGARSYSDSVWEKMDDSRGGDVIMLSISYALDDSISMYLNGDLYGSYTPNDSIATYHGGTSTFLMGLRHSQRKSQAGLDVDNNAFWAGAIHEARVYDTALSSTDIEALYQSVEIRNVPLNGAGVLCGMFLLAARRARK